MPSLHSDATDKLGTSDGARKRSGPIQGDAPIQYFSATNLRPFRLAWSS